MTAQDLERALEALEWSGAELARRVSVTAKQVSAWRTRKAKVPGAVAAYLRLRVQLQEITA